MLKNKSYVGKKDLEEKIVKIIEEAGMPVSIQYVTWHLENDFDCKVSWHTVRAILWKLASEGKIKAMNTTKSWIFFIEKEGEKQVEASG